MANLVDIFTQSSGLKGETTVLSTSEDLPKDKPSLFDSLLKTSIEDIENSSAQNTNSKIVSQNITSNLEKSPLDAEVIEVNTKLIDEGLDSQAINLDENSNSEEVIKDLSKNITNELNKDNTKKDEIKEPTKNIQNSISSNNSLLDRLALEVKNSNLEQVPKVEQILSEPLKNLENVDIENNDKTFIKSLDKVIEGLKSQNNSEEKLDSEKIIISQDDKLVEIIKEQEILIEDINGNNLQIKDENSQNLDDVNLETTQNLSQIIVNSEDRQNVENQIETSIVLKDSLNFENILIVEDEVANSDAIKNETVKNENNLNSQNILIVENEVVKTENNTKVDQKLSLMDQLIQTNSKKDITTKIEESTTSNPQSVEQINKNSKDVASNIFLAEQKNSLNNQLLFNKNEAVNILKNASSIEDIEKSANILDLDANNLEVEQNISSESLNDLSVDEKEILDRKNILNSILNEKNIRSIDVRNLITNSIEASKALLEDTINILDDKILDIQPNLVNSIQSRIVGAKQQMASMMSDVARQMYENYKPPVTVFRMNLNPGDLGTISVLMKQDKSSGLTINMSVSNITTLELLMENQNMLRNSLAKTFNDSANFNLDFSKGEGGQSQGDSSSNQNQRDKRDSNTQEILKLKKENKDYEEKNDYM
ncbi:flagellar hook-length control protein FliK [Arcobacter cryaerophilus gv. pseudocryaerophilus]|uniref:Flagellar hook-length control protein FliK n=3 Tax=Arcobacteraceae TaxID=2808963 RepID=A0AA96DTJ7_9BACT|nr:flagellar hook-length control protein FliK [Arcobacter sp. AZ-2023]WNL35589.1 flagellar hook-length control protein FliK [Arcobacter sp. AZ-2023]WPD11305.1 flagellar hook-length control protein FliK [Arcobacter sp. DSM 115960]